MFSNFSLWIQKWMSKRKKGDWIVVVLLGVLLLVVAMPTKQEQEEPAEKEGEVESTPVQDRQEETEYRQQLEERLTDILQSIEGVGETKVMITLRDDGQTMLNKDFSQKDLDHEEETVLVEQGDRQVPYVIQYRMPGIEGVLVVAKGASDAGIKTKITEAVMAVLALEAHQIQVLAMQ